MRQQSDSDWQARKTKAPVWEWVPNPELPRSEWTEGLVKAALYFTIMEQALWIATKKKRRVLFHFNAPQCRMAQFVAWCWHTRRPILCEIPKFRQGGVTTWWIGLNYVRCLMESDFHCAIVSHEEESALHVFDTVGHFQDRLDPEIVRRCPLKRRTRGDFSWANGANFWIGTAKASDALFKGPRLNALHCTEVANWADLQNRADLAFESAVNAVADNEHQCVTLESTGKGRDPFFCPKVEAALEGRDPSHVLFLPWFLDAEYTMPWERYRQFHKDKGRDPGKQFIPLDEELDLKIKLKDEKVEIQDSSWRYTHSLTDEQLIWRRWTIQTRCSGRSETFDRYYPTFLSDCFSATHGRLLVDQKVLQELRSRVCEPIDRGSIVLGEHNVPVFVQSSVGPLRVWERPEPTGEYVVACDPGSEDNQGDPTGAVVLKVTPDEIVVVAVMHGHWNHEDLSRSLAALGYWYSGAMLVVERNWNPAVVSELVRAVRYGRLYRYLDETARRGGTPGKAGFSTNKATRPVVESRIGAAIRRKKLKLMSREIVNELDHFAWDETKQNYQAESGKHDDLLMALGIGLYVCYPEDQDDKSTEDHGEEDKVLAWVQNVWNPMARRQADRMKAVSRAEVLCL